MEYKPCKKIGAVKKKSNKNNVICLPNQMAQMIRSESCNKVVIGGNGVTMRQSFRSDNPGNRIK